MSGSARTSRGHRKRVLVIDDSPPDVLLLQEMLATHGGFDVTAVHSGRQGLDLLEKPAVPFDLILVDWRIPGVSGDEIAQAYLRNTERKVRAPLVVLSSVIPSKLRISLEASGATVLEKPVDLKGYEALAALLASLIAQGT